MVNIGIIGAGRLGICLALLMENAGYDIVVSDIREDYVNNLNKKIIETAEPQVADYLKKVRNFKATTDNKKLIDQCDIIFTLVATPSISDGSYDVSAVWSVVRDFEQAPNTQGKTLVVGCTTNPGDCEKFQKHLAPYGVNVIYNPEFIAQGTIIKDLTHADMVLIGGDNPAVLNILCEMYNKIQITEPKINIMSTTAAELVKLAVNCYLTTKISYANMIGEVMIMSGLEDEIDTALTAIGNDSRVGNKYLRYGYGFGGPCLPRDNRAFANYAKKIGLDFPLGMLVDQFNQDHTQFLAHKLIKDNTLGLPFYMPSITYKPGTDIVEESQQLKFVVDLLQKGHVVYVEPNALVPDSVTQDLTSRFTQVRFVSIRDLEQQNTAVFRITI